MLAAKPPRYRRRGVEFSPSCQRQVGRVRSGLENGASYLRRGSGPWGGYDLNPPRWCTWTSNRSAPRGSLVPGCAKPPCSARWVEPGEAISDWFEAFHLPVRRHSGLRCRFPIDFEDVHPAKVTAARSTNQGCRGIRVRLPTEHTEVVA
jgi:hypothetical protein